MSYRLAWTFIVAFSVLVFSAPPAQATIMLRLDLRGLVGNADYIFTGKVLDTHSRWTDDGRYIVTDATVQVESDIQGNPGKSVVVRRLGGTVDGIGMRVAGVTELQQGEHVLLFTERIDTKRLRVVGMRQGLYRLQPDVQGRTIVHRTLGGLRFIEPSSSSVPVPAASPELANGQPESLDSFVSRVRDTIRACAKAGTFCRDLGRGPGRP